MSDPKGERGGDTGKTDQKGKGPQAEKGDQRRENRAHEGKTRPNNAQRGQAGSQSNEESRDK
jgi:hypothetical protein